MTEMDKILPLMPYGPGFLYVDEIVRADEDGIIGTYRFPPEAKYYDDHFPGNPVTPGVLITEAAAQIGLVAYSIWLGGRISGQVALTASNMQFLKPVPPGSTIEVRSAKIYNRFGKLKCSVAVWCKGELVAEGTLEGMIHG